MGNPKDNLNIGEWVSLVFLPLETRVADSEDATIICLMRDRQRNEFFRLYKQYVERNEHAAERLKKDMLELDIFPNQQVGRRDYTRSTAYDTLQNASGIKEINSAKFLAAKDCIRRDAIEGLMKRAISSLGNDSERWLEDEIRDPWQTSYSNYRTVFELKDTTEFFPAIRPLLRTLLAVLDDLETTSGVLPRERTLRETLAEAASSLDQLDQRIEKRAAERLKSNIEYAFKEFNKYVLPFWKVGAPT